MLKRGSVQILGWFAGAALAFAAVESAHSQTRVEPPSARLSPAPHRTAPSSRLIVNPETHNFGETIAGGMARHTFALNNDGTDMIIGTAECQGPFSVVSGSPYVLAPGQIATVTVEFAPKTAGVFSGLITFRGEYSALAIVSAAATAPRTAAASVSNASRPGLLLPAIVARGDGTSFEIRWQGEAGRRYQIWYSEDMGNWSPAGPPVTSLGGVTSFLDDGSATAPPPVAAPGRFYRVGESDTAIVGFRRIQLPPGQTPLSVPFLRTIAAQGVISALAPKSVTDASGGFQPGQFRSDASTELLTYVLELTSGDQSGRWFLIADNDSNTIRIDDLGGTYNLAKLLRVGDSYIVYPLHQINDVFGDAGETPLRRGDQILFWDVSAQRYEPPVTLDLGSPDNQPLWVQNGSAAEDLPIFPGEGMLVSRQGNDTVELVMAGTVPFAPILQQIMPGNNLVGHGLPLPITAGQSDLLASGFAGGEIFSRSDKLYLFNPAHGNFKTAIWYNRLLDRWLSPLGELNASQVPLAPASAFFIQRNQIRGFEWIQQPKR